MSFNEVLILFYEFGYVLYGLFFQQCYLCIVGVMGLCDYIEFLVQIYEYWVVVLEVMCEFFIYVEIGEMILDELMECLQVVVNFNQGFVIMEYMVVFLLDLVWYLFGLDEILEDVLEFEICVFDDIGMMEEIVLCYCLIYFLYIFVGGYFVGYYVYIWLNLLDVDGFIFFWENGLYDEIYVQCLWDNVYGVGGICLVLDFYVFFCGQELMIELLFEGCGLIESDSE